VALPRSKCVFCRNKRSAVPKVTCACAKPSLARWNPPKRRRPLPRSPTGVTMYRGPRAGLATDLPDTPRVLADLQIAPLVRHRSALHHTLFYPTPRDRLSQSESHHQPQACPPSTSLVNTTTGQKERHKALKHRSTVSSTQVSLSRLQFQVVTLATSSLVCLATCTHCRVDYRSTHRYCTSNTGCSCGGVRWVDPPRNYQARPPRGPAATPTTSLPSS
jgi:hypothetical protein